jgi:hypothetical protein
MSTSLRFRRHATAGKQVVWYTLGLNEVLEYEIQTKGPFEGGFFLTERWFPSSSVRQNLPVTIIDCLDHTL